MLDEAGRTVRAGKVHGQRRNALDPLQRIDRPRARDDLRSLRRQLVHDGESDALARPGNDRDLAPELEIHARNATALGAD